MSNTTPRRYGTTIMLSYHHHYSGGNMTTRATVKRMIDDLFDAADKDGVVLDPSTLSLSGDDHESNAAYELRISARTTSATDTER